MPELLGFTHRFEPSAPGVKRTLLALHGTGGDENDLVPLARELAPGAGILSPRGKVLEHGMPRFFRRIGEGVLDLADLHVRALELADFVAEARVKYALAGHEVIAFGYSNGANVATAMLFERPEALDGAILARAMLPYEPPRAPALASKRALLLAGQRDAYSRAPVTERLAAILRGAGADVQVSYAPAGHELHALDLERAHAWLGPRGAALGA